VCVVVCTLSATPERHAPSRRRVSHTAASCFGGRQGWCRRRRWRCVLWRRIEASRSDANVAHRGASEIVLWNSHTRDASSDPRCFTGSPIESHGTAAVASASWPGCAPRATCAATLFNSTFAPRNAHAPRFRHVATGPRLTDRRHRFQSPTQPTPARARQGELHPGGASGGGRRYSGVQIFEQPACALVRVPGPPSQITRHQPSETSLMLVFPSRTTLPLFWCQPEFFYTADGVPPRALTSPSPSHPTPTLPPPYPYPTPTLPRPTA